MGKNYKELNDDHEHSLLHTGAAIVYKASPAGSNNVEEVWQKKTMTANKRFKQK